MSKEKYCGYQRKCATNRTELHLNVNKNAKPKQRYWAETRFSHKKCIQMMRKVNEGEPLNSAIETKKEN